MSDSNPSTDVRGQAATLFVGALIAAYFAATWLIDPPTSASVAEYHPGRVADLIFKGALYVAAALLGLGGLLCAANQPRGVLIGAVAEAIFGGVFLVMAFDTFIEVRTFDYYVLVCAILGILGLSGFASAMKDYRAIAAASGRGAAQ